jgi:hypothetical protein
MKKLFLILLLFCLNKSFAQTLPDFDTIKLELGPDYKAAEPSATLAANYILSVPYDKKNQDRVKSVRFIVKWMSGTPDYSFKLDKLASKLMNDNTEVLPIYMACMTKYCTENKEMSKDAKSVDLNTVKLLLTYCENANNKMKMTKQLKKLSVANKNGELEKALEQ